MKITRKTLLATIEHNVELGNGSIKGTIEHQCYIHESKSGEIEFDLDFTDIKNITFMGMPIEEGYKHFDKFKKTMLELGIDVRKLFDDAAAELITDEDIDELKAQYKKMLGSQDNSTYIYYK